MPDSSDYEWLGWLINHPDEWSTDDLTTARFLVEDQKKAIEDMHPTDVRGRHAKQDVVDGLEAAIRAYVGRQATILDRNGEHEEPHIDHERGLDQVAVDRVPHRRATCLYLQRDAVPGFEGVDLVGPEVCACAQGAHPTPRRNVEIEAA